jgi:hypothetical protein
VAASIHHPSRKRQDLRRFSLISRGLLVLSIRKAAGLLPVENENENENEHFIAPSITSRPISPSVTPHLPTHILALPEPHFCLSRNLPPSEPCYPLPHETISKSQNGSTSLFTLPPRALGIQPALVLLLLLLNSHAIILIRPHIRTTNAASTTAGACTKAG